MLTLGTPAAADLGQRVFLMAPLRWRGVVGGLGEISYPVDVAVPSAPLHPAPPLPNPSPPLA